MAADRREGRGLSLLVLTTSGVDSTRSAPLQARGGGSKDASRKPPRMLGAQKHQEAPGRLGSSDNISEKEKARARGRETNGTPADT